MYQDLFCNLNLEGRYVDIIWAIPLRDFVNKLTVRTEVDIVDHQLTENWLTKDSRAKAEVNIVVFFTFSSSSVLYFLAYGYRI